MAAVPYIARGIQLVGGLISAKAQKSAGEVDQAAYNYNAKITEINVAREERASRTQTRKTLSSQRALYAKAGIDLSSGSPLLVMAESAAEGERNAMDIRFGGQNEANLQRYYGSQARRTGKIQAGTTLLTTIGNTATNYWQYSKVK